MLKVHPRLRDLKIEFEWSGKIGIVLNRTLTVGRTGDNVYYCQGYSGHGVCASHVMGEIMADAVSGTMERFDLFAGLKHMRTPGPRWLGNQLVALGMLYYRLKDKL
jgi:glycine/D-amino acid oxidase-like deaminating enzyme